ncbi:hypothetical protein NVP1103O_07 [Vibrio phage 1.103.O._10N.261.52.F2]|nr:hypothetical protein NVP1103O_07 [Vibrio phage 1.103.O._10N.261.52.F2]
MSEETRTVGELVNGDTCSYTDENLDYLYIGLNPVKPLFSYVVGNGQIVQRLTSKLSKVLPPIYNRERVNYENQRSRNNSVRCVCTSVFRRVDGRESQPRAMLGNRNGVRGRSVV